MPVRKRISRRREHLPAWSMVFQAGHDYFDDLQSIAVATDDYGRPDRKEVQAAWLKFGAAFLDQYNDRHHVPWAMRVFGEPWRKHRRARAEAN
jgi:hypothetical protein